VLPPGKAIFYYMLITPLFL